MLNYIEGLIMTAEEKRIKIVELMTEYATKCNIAFTLLTDNIPEFITDSDSLYKYSVIGIGGPDVDAYFVFNDQTEVVNVYTNYKLMDEITTEGTAYDLAVDVYRRLTGGNE